MRNASGLETFAAKPVDAMSIVVVTSLRGPNANVRENAAATRSACRAVCPGRMARLLPLEQSCQEVVPLGLVELEGVGGLERPRLEVLVQLLKRRIASRIDMVRPNVS